MQSVLQGQASTLGEMRSSVTQGKQLILGGLDMVICIPWPARCHITRPPSKAGEFREEREQNGTIRDGDHKRQHEFDVKL